MECVSLTDGFRARLRGVRDLRGLSRWGLSVRALIPVGSIAQYETGRCLPSPERAEVLAEALGVAPGWLLFGDGEPPEGLK